ncbi:hypothetical protein BKA60DRAFT_660557 [Fusarium oxysporum]|nr:hypothetical protein BKA60DRAFT_660557 [Fusarium oxysporum]
MYWLPLRQYRSLEAPGLIFLVAKGPMIAAVLEALDVLLDRCEDTACKTSRSILRWLRSMHALAGYPKPFILVQHPSSSRKYRVLFKRCLLLILRSYCIGLCTLDRLTGIWFKRKQFSSLGGFMQRCLSYDYSEDKREDDDEENVIESSEEDCEYWSDESQVVRHTGNEKPRGDEQVSQELIELVFGLSLSLCTEQVTDGQPSSTLLVFFSGILGFSSSLGTFLPAKLYTPYLSGLLYIQRILFLDMALPLREYPTLELSQRPRTKQLERLEVSAFEEMISFRSYGRVMARSESPAFLLRWSEDGQTMHCGDLLHISMAELRLLSKHIIQQTDRLREELIFGWGRFIGLSRLKDDLKNAEKGFSFVTHQENNIDNAYLQLCERTCSVRRGGLTVKGNRNQKAVFKYIRAEETLCEYLSLGLYHPCGQSPRWPDLSSLTCVNREWGMRGIFVYNGSMIYLIRHHKAKRSTNREFVVYLVFIRPFVDLLDRQCHLGFSDRGRSSPSCSACRQYRGRSLGRLGV